MKTMNPEERYEGIKAMIEGQKELKERIDTLASVAERYISDSNRHN